MSETVSERIMSLVQRASELDQSDYDQSLLVHCLEEVICELTELRDEDAFEARHALEIVEPFHERASNPLILYPSAFKPPLPSQVEAVEQALKRYPRSELNFLISQKPRGKWTAKDSVTMWQLLFPNLKTVCVGNPVGDAIDEARSNHRVIILCTEQSSGTYEAEAMKENIAWGQFFEAPTSPLDFTALEPILHRRMSDQKHLQWLIGDFVARPERLSEMVTPDEYAEFLQSVRPNRG